jgi:hypothetical protein
MNNDDQQQSPPLVIEVIDDFKINNSEKIIADLSTEIQQDETLALKMQCVNDAIDEIGFTSYQLKLFFLNGFGYAVDSLLILLNALTQPQVAMQYSPAISKAQTISVGIGLLFGALFWGLGADVSFYKKSRFFSDKIRRLKCLILFNVLDYRSQICFQYHIILVCNLCYRCWSIA